MMALEHDMIGMASTNSVRYGAPTFGRDVMLGTNPLAYAIPADKEPAFVLDFARTTVPKGKLEVYKSKGLPLKEGWAIDRNGNMTTDPDEALRGALLPLGGFGTDHGGHKGYGLGLLVDILCGVLSGGKFGTGLPLVTDTMEGASLRSSRRLRQIIDPGAAAANGALAHFDQTQARDLCKQSTRRTADALRVHEMARFLIRHTSFECTRIAIEVHRVEDFGHIAEARTDARARLRQRWSWARSVVYSFNVLPHPAALTT